MLGISNSISEETDFEEKNNNLNKLNKDYENNNNDINILKNEIEHSQNLFSDDDY